MTSILEEASSLVNGERQQNYGDINESFTRIAGLWSAYTGCQIDKYDVAKMMILLKVSRAKNTNHLDSYVDMVGYALCADKLLGKDYDAKTVTTGNVIGTAPVSINRT